ncbi:MAG: hypothetical protein QXN23_01665 [Candidatus Caldarchaeum sp.]
MVFIIEMFDHRVQVVEEFIASRTWENPAKPLENGSERVEVVAVWR